MSVLGEEEYKRLVPLALELVNAAAREDDFDFPAYCYRTVEGDELSEEDVHRLIAMLATFAANAVTCWAEDMEVPAAQILQSIAADMLDP